MNVHITEWTMISDITPESAYRTIRSGDAVWRLSWLPDQLLTRAQAQAGMELDEILSDPSGVHDRLAHYEAARRADTVGIIWQQAVILLFKRIAGRLHRSGETSDQHGAQGEPVDTGRTLHSEGMSLHHTGPPRVVG
ncbi:hypothetical protein [Nocardia australiensis]|uniref:hypothetical protein n=1 Tax=Nocardia australiensis TaxID=2887191 RepID=UPI001D148D5B|nr:hypothetical protein [Nocardia australiensis]